MSRTSAELNHLATCFLEQHAMGEAATMSPEECLSFGRMLMALAVETRVLESLAPPQVTVLTRYPRRVAGGVAP